MSPNPPGPGSAPHQGFTPRPGYAPDPGHQSWPGGGPHSRRRVSRGLLVALSVGAALLAVVLTAGVVWWQNTERVLLLRTLDSEHGAAANAETTELTAELLRQRLELAYGEATTVTRVGDDLIEVRAGRGVDLEALSDSLTDRESIAFHPVLAADSGTPAADNPWDDAPGPADPTGDDWSELTTEELEELLGRDLSGPDPDLVELTVTDGNGQELQLGAAELRGGAVLDARPGQQGTSWTLDITFTPEGAEGWRRLTGNAACHGMEEPQRRVAIVLGEELLSAPVVNPDVVCGVGISGDATSIAGPAGNFDSEGAREMADRILLGELHLPVEVVEIS
ncbi:hypothetical protein NE857_19480 [Nocardiopsis exhalans]|uniref:SecDF P1 head subdomain domain-containing protein n=1 Tax=Nocardiopsis exhalans TaxID=163604 RepID=A0ABY5CZY7_9ACTN|nr:hypothetical protein [Nocardiopsis exhalans]USY17521.1 hypothetical protein NE857_19480 [Nocardiopsis exhalans]